MDCSPPCSSVHGILQARKLEWVVMPSSREFSQPRDQTHISYVSYIDRQVLYETVGKPTFPTVCVWLSQCLFLVMLDRPRGGT